MTAQRSTPHTLSQTFAWVVLALSWWLVGCSFDRASYDDLVACASDDDCESGICTNGFCTDGVRVEPCDGLCAEDTEVCDEATNTCLCATGETPTACSDGQLCCASGCLDVTTDVANCGGCGVTCGAGETCSGGFCVCGETTAQGMAACPDPRTCRNGACTNTDFDPTCCGTDCTDCEGRACIGGECQCAPGTDNCDAEAAELCATNILTDPGFCGGCGTTCLVGQECVGGTCSCGGQACPAEDNCCGTVCLTDAELLTNTRHCGACGNACPANHACVDGSCTCGTDGECGATEFCCGPPGARQCVTDELDPLCVCGTSGPCSDDCCDNGSPADETDDYCADLEMEDANCGACGVSCGAEQSCQSGACVCDTAGEVICDGECVDRLTDRNHCGACGNDCEGGMECCAGACVDLNDSIGNCGECGAFCNGDGCSDGACECNDQPVDLGSDVDNCGSCDNVCARPNLTGVQCMGGTCRYGMAQCMAGFGDCNNDPMLDGCETPTSSDPANCGACGTACASGEVCAGGACVEVDVVVQVEVGLNFACARHASGIVECWGKDDKGQLGNGMGGDSQVPVPIANLLAVDIAVGTKTVCAATTTGEVKCWGENNAGEIGKGSPGSQQTPSDVALDGPATRVAVGLDHSCAIIDRTADGGAVGEVWCWGKGNEGRLGHNSTSNSSSPVRARNLTGATAIGAGEKHTCARKDDNTVWCWGEDDDGRLADGRSGNHNVESPQQISLSNAPAFVDLSVGYLSSFAVDTQNRIWGWGLDESNILLAGGGEPPIEIASGYTAVDAGRTTACGITTASGLECWGLNDENQTGTGSGDDPVDTPTAVDGLDAGVLDVSVGWDSACAVVDSGGVLCWGKDTDGILGNGPAGDSSTPTPVVGLP